MKRALVIGGNVGGLTSAAMLERAGWQVLVRTRGAPIASFDDALGIWSPALAAMRTWLGPAAMMELASAGHFVTDVDGYHDGRGQHLCGPAAPLGDGSGERPSLLFVPRSALLRTLRGACGDGVTFADEGDGGGGLASMDEAGAWDLLVGADGADSSVRTMLYPTAARPVDWGFHIYRGIATRPQPSGRQERRAEAAAAVAAPAGSHGAAALLPSGRSFQAWGAGGERFAAVPTAVRIPSSAGHQAGGHAASAVAWFATARGPPPADAHTAPAARAAVRALALSRFAPCAAALVDATADVHLCPPVQARAHSPGLLRAALAPRAARARAPAFVGGGGQSGGEVAVALIGDAAYTLDPILAQGAGVAIEDAAELAACTAAWKRADGEAALDAALARFAVARRPRLQVLAAVSLLPDRIGQMAGWQAALRDRLLLAVPAALSSAAFEAALRLSLAPAPLAGQWRYVPPAPPDSEAESLSC